MKTNINNQASHLISSRELLALATFATMTTSFAQETTNQNNTLEDTVITAEKTDAINPKDLSSHKSTAPLLDTPQTVNVVTKEVFEQQGARNLTDVLKNTPGISFSAGENGFASSQNNFNLRGTDTSGSIFVDGVRDSGSFTRDIFNVERVEIAKGAADENGRGGAGGYVNIVSKTPSLTNFFNANSSVAHSFQSGDPLFRQSFDVNRIIEMGDLAGTAFRLNTFFQEGGIPGRGNAENNSWGIAPSFTLGLGTPTSLNLSFLHTQSNDIPDFGVPAALIKGTLNYDSNTNERDTRNFYGTNRDYDDVTNSYFTATLTHEFPQGGVLTNQFRYGETDRDAAFVKPSGYDASAALPTDQVSGFALRYNRENSILSNQLNYVREFETGDLEHKISTGIDFSREESSANRYASGTVDNTSLSNPNPDRNVIFGNKTSSADIQINTIAAYLYDTLKINNQWQITGGLRAEYYDMELTDSNGTFSYDKNDTYIGGKFGVVYKPQENTSYYASTGLSHLPPGSFLSSSDISRDGANAFPGAGGGVNNPDADTQQNWNYEVGGKWDFFDGRLSTTASLFYTNRKNIVISDGRGGVIGDGEQNLYGAEFGVSGQITDQWSVFGGLLVMNSERDHFTDQRNTSGRPEGTFYGDVNGDELAFTPNISANLWTTYNVTDQLTLGGGIQYVGESFVGRTDDHDRIIPNGANGELPDYIVFNALASYELNENVTLRLNIDNVFDEVYAVSTNWSSTTAQAGAPRTFTLSAEWKF